MCHLWQTTLHTKHFEITCSSNNVTFDLYGTLKQVWIWKDQWLVWAYHLPVFMTFTRGVVRNTAGFWHVVSPICYIIDSTAVKLKQMNLTDKKNKQISKVICVTTWHLHSDTLTFFWILSQSLCFECVEFPFASFKPFVRSVFTLSVIWTVTEDLVITYNVYICFKNRTYCV